MSRLGNQIFGLTLFVCLAVTSSAQEIPLQLRGRWIVTREIPTRTISCWGENEARSIIGTEIDYTADEFRWKDLVTPHPTVQIAVVTAEQFHDQYSGGPNDSQVDFRQLGIKGSQAKQITLGHKPANFTGATIEIPGDVVLIKGPNTIVFSVCNVYFEAHRQTNHK